jgi:hypothetical protein
MYVYVYSSSSIVVVVVGKSKARQIKYHKIMKRREERGEVKR